MNIEDICAKVHQAYCEERIKQGKEPYWTGGDYNKLDEAAKDYDRATVKAVFENAAEPVEFTKEMKSQLYDASVTDVEVALNALTVAEKCFVEIDRLSADLASANDGVDHGNEVIEAFARHKHGCKMGEYNSIKIGKGCDCGLSKALKGELK